MARNTPDSDNDTMCDELKKDDGWNKSANNSRPVSVSSESDRSIKKWIDIVSGMSNYKFIINLKSVK